MIRPFFKVLSLAMALSVASTAWAADKTQTLADIRKELDQLGAQLQSLKSQLVAGGQPAIQAAGGASALDRMNALEAELTRLTADTEKLQIRVEKVVNDGTNRIGDLEFRLCELEKGCDTSKLPATPTLGGSVAADAAPVAAAVTKAPATAGSTAAASSDAAAGQELTISEQSDFDAAKKAFDGGDFKGAADKFGAFAQDYPGGPLTGSAQVMQGDALGQAGDTTGAAKAYLAAFSADPKGKAAPKALLKLGASLGLLGQTQDACVTLNEVGVRFPQAPEAADATAAKQKLGCQ